MGHEILAGKYNARVTDFGISETKAGLPQVVVRLSYNDADGDTKAVTWYGSLKEGTARNITMAALKDLGLKEGTPIDALCDGPAGNALSLDLDVAIGIEMQEYNGRWTPRVNIGGTSGGGQKLARDTAREKLAAMGLATSVKTDAESKPPVDQKAEDDKIPF